MLEQIKTLLDCLGLKGITSCLDATLSDAEKHGTAVANVLLELLTAQHHYEQARPYRAVIRGDAHSPRLEFREWPNVYVQSQGSPLFLTSFFQPIV